LPFEILSIKLFFSPLPIARLALLPGLESSSYFDKAAAFSGAFSVLPLAVIKDDS